MAEFGLLGPLRVRADGVDLPVRRGKQRVVLAVLLLNAGRVVPTERLIDALWADNPPVSAEVTVRNYVMRLRRDLGALKDRVLTRPPGYLIRVNDGELDVACFEGLLESARDAEKSGEWETAAEAAAEALALWRGDPLCDVASEILEESEATRLADLRLQALQTRIEADLRLGRHAEVVGELERLTAAYPLREGLWAQLMLALYRSSRQADAQAAFRRAREIIVDELGVEPGAELRGLHERILSGDPGLTGPEAGRRTGPGTVVPRQLPPAVSGFVGRDRELGVLSGILDHAGGRPSGSVVISAIGGTAGVGKTALAVQWAHQVSGHFPDGQLYVNLRGYDPDQPVAAGDALAGFLRALGLAGDRIPEGVDERAAEFRSLLAGRRVLIVLDNAREAEQVRPLLPGNASCLVVVTSRDAMTGLVARDGATRVDLDLLSAAEAARLLRDLIGERAAADPGATARLAECCCRLPLALRVAAELVNGLPDVPLADMAAELADQQRRLDLLAADGDARTAVREVFSWSYRNLDTATARVFRLAGLHPGPDFDAYTTAALAGTGLAKARTSLDRLARAHLIQPAGPGRYGLHDLLRDYARELAAITDGEEGCRAALTRLFDYYVHTAEIAARVLGLIEQSHYRPVRPRVATAVPVFADTDEASAWLEAERANLVAVAGYAADNSWPGHAITLSAILFRYLDLTFHPSDSRAIHSAALAAARLSGDREGEAHALNNLTMVDWRLGRFQEAGKRLDRALSLFRDIGDQYGEARTLNNLAGVDTHVGRFRQAVDYLHQSLILHRAVGNQSGEVRALFNLCFDCGRLGRYQEAAGYAREALALSRKIGNPDLEGYVLENLATACLGVGQYQEADGHFRRALALCREIGDRATAAGMLGYLADIDCRAGRHEQAVSRVREGLTLCREVGDWVLEARLVNTFGEVLLAVGQTEKARIQHAAALELSGRTGDPYEQARAHHGLGRVCLELGDPGQARAHWERARTLYTEMEVPEAEQVRSLLAGLPESGLPEPGLPEPGPDQRLLPCRRNRSAA